MLDLVVLDVNETLFPLDPIARRMAEVGLEGRTDVWFTRILRDGIAAAAAGRFASFSDLARHHLLDLLAGGGLGPDDAAAEHVLGGFSEVSPHPDVAPGLRALRDAGVPAVALTNGSAELTHAFLARAGLIELVAGVHDVVEVGRWKPAPDAYRHVLQLRGVVAERTAMVAVHPWDLLGARSVGMVSAWLARDAARFPGPFGAPDVQAATLSALVEALLERQPPA